MSPFPNVNRWMEVIEKREAVKKGVTVGAHMDPAGMRQQAAEVGVSHIFL